VGGVEKLENGRTLWVQPNEIKIYTICNKARFHVAG